MFVSATALYGSLESALSNLSMQTGRIVADSPIDVSAEFDFSSSPGELGGHLEMRGIAKMSEALEAAKAGDIERVDRLSNGTLP